MKMILAEISIKKKNNGYYHVCNALSLINSVHSVSQGKIFAFFFLVYCEDKVSTQLISDEII